jgi:hypothetical protein
MSSVNENRPQESPRFHRDFSPTPRSSRGWDSVEMAGFAREFVRELARIASVRQTASPNFHSVSNTVFLKG